MYLDVRPLTACSPNPKRKPFDANQAVATILFGRTFNEFAARYPALRRIFQRRLAFFAYPLSGGGEHRSSLPDVLVRPVLRLERLLAPVATLLAFRVAVVIERTASSD
jgi:hypothetical protein